MALHHRITIAGPAIRGRAFANARGSAAQARWLTLRCR
jgi:hypothetical protein